MALSVDMSSARPCTPLAAKGRADALFAFSHAQLSRAAAAAQNAAASRLASAFHGMSIGAPGEARKRRRAREMAHAREMAQEREMAQARSRAKRAEQRAWRASDRGDAPPPRKSRYGMRSQQQSEPGAADKEVLEAGEYLVDRLRGKRTVVRKRRKVTQFLVRWAWPYNDNKWDTWEPETHLYHDGLVETYNRRVADDRVDNEEQFSDGGGYGDGGGDGDDDDDDDGYRGGGGGGNSDDWDDEEPKGAYDVSKLLVYDTNSSTIKTSLALILQSVQAPTPDWLEDVLEELVVTALWRLECVRVRDSELPDAALAELLNELQKINKDSLDAEFAALGRQPGRSRAADAQPILRADFDAAKRADSEQRIKQRANASRASTNAEWKRLLDLLASIDTIKAIKAGAPRPPRSNRLLVETVLDQHATLGAKWWLFFLRPKLRIHQQNQLMRYRGPGVQSWLDWYRGRVFPPPPRPSLRAADLLGSAYTGDIPQLATSSTIPVEHAVPQSWYSRATQILENSAPREDACGVVLATKVENSQKSNKPVWFGSANGGVLTVTPDHNLYRPTDAATFWTRARQAVVARCIVYSFLTYFIAGEGSSNGFAALDSKTGSQYYRMINDKLLSLTQQPVGALEELNSRVISDKVAPGWRNPLCFHAVDLLGTASMNPLAPRFRELLRKRLAGESMVPKAVATALRGNIFGLPTEA